MWDANAPHKSKLCSFNLLMVLRGIHVLKRWWLQVLSCLLPTTEAWCPLIICQTKLAVSFSKFGSAIMSFCTSAPSWVIPYNHFFCLRCWTLTREISRYFRDEVEFIFSILHNKAFNAVRVACMFSPDIRLYLRKVSGWEPSACYLPLAWTDWLRNAPSHVWTSMRDLAS